MDINSMCVWTSCETEQDCLLFASLDFKGKRPDWIQAYYSNLFDLWESPPCELSPEADNKLREARWSVEEYASKRHLNLDRDSKWLVCFCGSKDWNGLLIT